MRMKVIIKLMSSSGLRISEVINLQENAINYDMRQILIFGKGSKERLVPVTNEIVKDVYEAFEKLNKMKLEHENLIALFENDLPDSYS